MLCTCYYICEMAATTNRSFGYFNRFFSFITLVFFYLGCFIIFTPQHQQNSSYKKRKISPGSTIPRFNDESSSSSSSLFSWYYLKKIFSFKSKRNRTDSQTPLPQTIPASPSVDSSRCSSIISITPANTNISTPSRKRRTPSLTDSSFDHNSFPLRNDIFPCPTCGEIFHTTQFLENHQSVKHAVSELYDGDSGKNIVNIIFKTSWNDQKTKNPTIYRILKIHNSPKILAKFEEYREHVKSKAMSSTRKRDERCIADGNELLRFHCATFMCSLGQNGNSSLCTQPYCSVCGIIRLGFSAKMDGISTMSSSWKAHQVVPDDLEEEFAFMNVKRAMLICRVVAGRIGSDQEENGKDDSGFDSVVGSRENGGGGTYSRSDEDELLVFNPRAVLPCFAIVYSV